MQKIICVREKKKTANIHFAHRIFLGLFSACHFFSWKKKLKKQNNLIFLKMEIKIFQTSF